MNKRLINKEFYNTYSVYIDNIVNYNRGNVTLINENKREYAFYQFEKFIFCECDVYDDKFIELIDELPKGNMIISSYENELLKDLSEYQVFERINFSSFNMCNDEYCLPLGYCIESLNVSNVSDLKKIDSNLLGSYKTEEEFLKNGMATIIYSDSRIPVCAASSYAKYHNKTDIQITTSTNYRGMGLAKAACIHFLHQCINEGIDVNWSAANIASYHLALKLGFYDESRFKVFWRPL